MQLVDIHTHKICSESDVIAIRNISLKEFEKIPQSEIGFFSLGIHPWEVKNISEQQLNQLEKLAADSRVKIIGECGLDKTIDTILDTQLYLFKKQIEISEKLKKPIIIHCVGYYNELFAFRKELNPTQKWIIHGFRGKSQLALQALQYGFEISFGEKFNTESVKITPIENMYVETDESKKSIKEIYKSIAEIKQCSVNSIISALSLLNL